MNNNKGFTLVELLVVVLIIGILAAMAMPAYFKAVERARASEADTMIGTVVNAQQRYKMKTGKYAKNWTSLDVAPANAVAAAAYCTKGAQPAVGTTAAKPGTGVCGSQNAFYIVLYGDSALRNNTSGVIAYRVGTGQYTYSLQKLYDSTNPAYCVPGSATAGSDDELFCMDYHGVETSTEIPKTVDAGQGAVWPNKYVEPSAAAAQG